MTLVVVGVGNAWRGDDAAGLEVARLVAAAAPRGVRVVRAEGDQAALADLWAGARAAVVVDAARSGAPPGTVQRFDARAGRLPVRLTRSSSHAFGVAEAVELARALGRLPAALEVVAIEGACFDHGAGLSPAVAAAVEAVAAQLSARAAGCAPAR